jgi:hypothetical protein
MCRSSIIGLRPPPIRGLGWSFEKVDRLQVMARKDM